MLWGVVENHIVEEPKSTGEIGINDFILVYLMKTGDREDKY